MLLLLFHLGSDRYAIDSSQVIEIIPLINLKKVSSSVSHIAGIFNYGGKVVPVIDLGQLIHQKSCQALLSTRIILVYHSFLEQNSSLLGLVAEKVTDTIAKNEEDFISAEFQAINTSDLGDMIHDEQGMIQYIHLDHLSRWAKIVVK